MHITLLYGLHDKLGLLPPVCHDMDVKLPSCLSAPLRMKLIATLATHFNKSAWIIWELIPQNTWFAQYGHVRQLEGGGIMHAHDFVPFRSDSQDISFVQISLPPNYFVHINLLVLQYQLAIDKFAHLPHRTPKFGLQDFFGQIPCFIIVDILHFLIYNIKANSFIYTFINQVKISDLATNHCGINYYEDLGPTEFVDLNQIECIVGRIKDHGKWSIIDWSRLLAQDVAECI